MDYKVLLEQWHKLRGGAEPLSSVVRFPPNRCVPADEIGYRIKPDKMYFTVRLNERHLAENRDWWVRYDPLVIVGAEFLYNGKLVTVPKVVGPELVQELQRGGSPRFGTVLHDTLIAGPHPYCGGDVVFSVRFYRVQRDNLVRSILKTVEGLSKISLTFSDADAVMAVGSAILSGVEGLLGLDSTVCLAAYRGSLAPSSTRPFSAQYAALILPPAPEDLSAFNIKNGRLFFEASSGACKYDRSDFALFSVEGAEDRDDVYKFAFATRRIAALKALGDGKDGLVRAKSHLISAYAEMLESPDMIGGQSDKLFKEWRQELKNRNEELAKTRALGPERDEEPDSVIKKLNLAIRELEI